MISAGRRNPRTLPKLPPWAKYVVAGIVLTCLVYAMLLLDRMDREPEVGPETLPGPPVVAVPELDKQILAEIDDGTRVARLQVEKEPLRHLLREAIDVGPSVAAALNMPAEMVPLEELRQDIGAWRMRWLYYEGKLAQLTGPRSGHPIDGYSIFDATVELANGEHVLATFSVPPDAFKVGDWVRVEGYLMKLRDVPYPLGLQSAPLLVGREMFPDYEDWPPVTELDRELLGGIDDSSAFMGDLPSRWIEDDQTEELWHLGAFVRDTADQHDLADWRKVEPLAIGEVYERIVRNEIPRGERMRIFGTLIRRRTIVAPPNPANIKYWTTAWVQTSSFGGHLIPIWVPGEVGPLPRRAQLEVRGYYYRWYVYDAERKRIRIPLFIAPDLHTFDLETDKTMGVVGGSIAGVATLALLFLIWSQRRAAKRSEQHSRDMDARRRRRRERVPSRDGAPTDEAAGATSPPPSGT